MKKSKSKVKVLPKTKRKVTPPSGPRGFVTPSGQVIKSLGVTARAIGVSVGMLSMVLDGKRRPSMVLALKWSSFLGVSVERFWLMLYGVDGIVPADSPVSARLRREKMPRFLAVKSQDQPPRTDG